MRFPDPPWDAIGTPAWPAFFEELVCPRGHIGLIYIGPAKPPHFASYECGVCGHVRFMPAPPMSGEGKRTKRRGGLLPTNEDYCHNCLLTRSQCELLGRRLEDAHTIDRATLLDAGLPADDTAAREWLCNICHARQQVDRREAAQLVAIFGAAA